MPAFSLLITPPHLYSAASQYTERSPTTPSSINRRKNSRLRLFVSASLHFRRAIPRLVSCYAFFQGWLLLSRPPRCLWNNTSFPTKQILETLAVDLGCFPLASGA